MTERTTVRLPEELLRRAKRKAAAERRTLADLIEEGLRRVLNDGRTLERPERRMPPVSTAKGGLLPGIDLNGTAALEMDDQDHIRK